MKLIVGLGNPQDNFTNTRHNFGYMVIDGLIEKYKSALVKRTIDPKNQVLLTKNMALLKPADGMNISGEAVKKAVDQLNINLKTYDLIVLYDDMDFELGQYKINHASGAGKHNGIKSIFGEVAQHFTRIRLGIGRPKDVIAINHVLSPFRDDELTMVNKVINKSIEIVEFALDNDVGSLMSKYNTKGES